MIASLAALALSLITGWALVSWLLGRSGRGPGMLLVACFAGGVGLLVSSLGFLLVRVLDAIGRGPLLLTDLTLLGAAVALYRYAPRLDAVASAPRPQPEAERAWRVVLLSALALALAAGVAQLAAYVDDHPHGFWDAWAIWNLKARFLLGAADEWRRAFSPVIGWSQPDYPLLLPSNVARLWVYEGATWPGAPALLSVSFAALTLATLFGAVSHFRGRAQACLAALALLATPGFLVQGAFQIADVPLAFFLLGALVSAGLAGRSGAETTRAPLLLAGALAGAAAWTKNEGALMALAVAASVVAISLRTGGARRGFAALRAMGRGLLLPLLVLVAYKLFLAGESGLLAGQRAGDWATKATDWSRHRAILDTAASALRSETGGWILVEIALLALVAGPERDRGCWLLRRVTGGTLLLALSGYYVVYLFTPYRLDWHLETSAPRLLMQLWPSVLLLVFVTLRAPSRWWVWRGRPDGSEAAG